MEDFCPKSDIAESFKTEEVDYLAASMKYHCKNPMMHQRAFIYANLIWTCEVKVKTHCLSSLGCTIISTRCEQRISPRYCTSDYNNSIELTTAAEEICPNILFSQI